MAKKRGRRKGSKTSERQGVPETVGSALGSVMAKVDAWMAQREEIARELRAAADRILSGENPFGGGKAPVPFPYKPEPQSARKRPVMSAEARARIAEAQRKRWAAQKASQAPAVDAETVVAAPAKKSAKKAKKK